MFVWSIVDRKSLLCLSRIFRANDQSMEWFKYKLCSMIVVYLSVIDDMEMERIWLILILEINRDKLETTEEIT